MTGTSATFTAAGKTYYQTDAFKSEDDVRKFYDSGRQSTKDMTFEEFLDYWFTEATTKETAK